MVIGTRRAALVALILGVAHGCGSSKEGDQNPPKSESAMTAAAASGSGTAAKTDTKADKGDVIARVNGVAIPRAEFDAKYNKMTKAFTTRNKEIPENLARRYRESILKQLIERELLRQKIASAGIKIDPAELEKEFEDYKKMFRTEQNFERYLKSSDISVDRIKENIAHNIAVNKLLEKFGDLTVDEQEAREYYEQYKKRYEIKEQVRASHILLKVDAKADKKVDEAARKRALDIYRQAIKKDADFAELARKYSQGPTASRGGDLSYFPRGRMVPEFEEVAFKMKPGEISKPVRTQFGWHIIKVVDHKEGRQRPFEEVRESIEKLLRNKKVRKAKQELLKTLRAEAKIETFLEDQQPSSAAANKGAGAAAEAKGSGASSPAPH